MEVTTIPTVMHSGTCATASMEIGATAIVPSSSAYHMPGMAATIAGIEHGTTKEEIITVRITGIDTEMPITAMPV